MEEIKINIRKFIIPFAVILFYIILYSHPFIYCKYFFKTIFNNNTYTFFISSSHLYLDSYYEDSLDISEYFSTSSNKSEKLKKINISDFNDEDDYIYIEAQYTNKINKCQIYINNISTKLDTTTNYDLFNKNYICKTTRTWIQKDNLIENDINKIDFHISNDVYTYYFYIEN